MSSSITPGPIDRSAEDVPAVSSSLLPSFEKPGATWLRAAGIGLLLALAQLGFVLFMATAVPGQGLAQAYGTLAFGDSEWYANIMERGYQSRIPPEFPDGISSRQRESNVAFFPGYPWAALGVQKLLGVSAETALLWTAQLCCWGFWTYFVLLLQSWRTPPLWSALAVFTVFVHPVAYYLVCGYSESLFLMMLLGFIYWSERPGWLSQVLAGAHGFAMTATRLVGLPLVVYPLWYALRPGGPGRSGSTWQRLRGLVPAASASALAGLGAALFFVYCQWRFGQWNLYMETQRLGWQVVPDYLGPFDIGFLFTSPHADRSYWPVLDRGDQWLAHSLSRLSMPLLGVMFLAIAVIEMRVARHLPGSGFYERLGLYIGAALLLYVPATGMIQAKFFMQSMVRYGFCVHVLLVLALGRLTASVPAADGKRQWAVFRAVLIYDALALAIQAWCVTVTANGVWFA